MKQSSQATHRLVDAMKKDGLLSLVETPNHKRYKLIDLTESGMKIYNRCRKSIAPSMSAVGADQLTKIELQFTL